LGDYWHGNPEKFDPDDTNKICHKTYNELYNETFKKFDILKMNGYNVKYIWETDWKRFKANIDKTPKILNY
ncbi:MAG: hypothetical protein V1769_03775, partial [Thermoplasmatota archaeon]